VPHDADRVHPKEGGMIRADRELLRRMATVNRHLGDVLLAMQENLIDGQLNPDDLLAIGLGFVALGADMVRRADELTAATEPGQTPSLAGAELVNAVIDMGTLLGNTGVGVRPK
jgi:hypothetical protein